jgi:hypothetical protein
MTSLIRTKNSKLKDLRRKEKLADKVIHEYDRFDFKGRVQTREVTRARITSRDCGAEIERLTN